MPTISMKFAMVREVGGTLNELSQDLRDVGAKLDEIQRELPEELRAQRGIGASMETVGRSVHTLGADTAALARFLINACNQYHGTDRRLAKLI